MHIVVNLFPTMIGICDMV